LRREGPAPAQAGGRDRRHRPAGPGCRGGGTSIAAVGPHTRNDVGDELRRDVNGGRPTRPRMSAEPLTRHEVVLDIEGMTCASCVTRLERVLATPEYVD